MKTIESRLPIPLFSTPLESNNPTLVFLSNMKVTARISARDYRSVEVKLANGDSDEYRDLLASSLHSFYEFISSEIIERGLKVVVEGDLNYALGVYASLTTETAKLFGLSNDDLIEATSSIDALIGIRKAQLTPMRYSLIVGRPIVYRRSEGFIELGGGGLEPRVIEVFRVVQLSEPIVKEPLSSIIIHLGGYAVIELVKCILEHGLGNCREIVELSSRSMNSIYYILYGLQSRSMGEVYIVDLDNYVAVASISY
ncbi:MAG: hypothetical protein RMI83_05645 [Desulfurococcaceae archaeon]|nr:hypothetical protein [Sulfolobales archaeon]MDW8170564.1 hypothetical protein [Desulfurococcaceae archaeon]